MHMLKYIQENAEKMGRNCFSCRNQVTGGSCSYLEQSNHEKYPFLEVFKKGLDSHFSMTELVFLHIAEG